MTTPLATALPDAEFVEHHSLVIAAPPSAVWAALQSTTWSDLRWAKPLIAARGLGFARRNGSPRRLLDAGPVVVVHSEDEAYVCGVRIARPWKARPEIGPPVSSLDELRHHREPGWLKYGMDFTLHPLPGGRTRLSTSTRCEPTDADAGRRFRRYWAVIRPFSGLIRWDMLRAIADRATRGMLAAA